MTKKLLFLFSIFSFSFLTLRAQVIPPYSSSFDGTSDTVGWSHSAVYGTDNWELGSPSKSYLNGTLSSPNAWVTKVSGTPTATSSMILQTPAYDLSDTAGKYYISFYQKRHSFSGMSYYVEYSLTGGASWLMLSGAGIPQSNWQTLSSGFTAGSVYTYWQYSTFCLKTLQGNSSVIFRFRMNTNSSVLGDGWMIDNFDIRKEDFNFTANRGNDITNINKYFTAVTVTSPFGFNGPYAKTMTNNFYFSKDSIFDVADSLIYSTTASYTNSIPTWSLTMNIPANLFAKTYYIFYQLEALNNINETSETDNVNYIKITLDSIIVPDYSDNFDHTNELWNKNFAVGTNKWMKGDPNQWQAEDPHSGNNAWFPVDSAGSLLHLESPYLNLQSVTNTTICFWFRDGHVPTTYSPSWVETPISTLPATTSPPVFPGTVSTLLPFPRNDWDCYCKSLSVFDGNYSTRFRIVSGYADQVLPDVKGIVVDDVYIGSAKADASLEGNKLNRFTTAARSSDTLFYLYYNSGLQSLPVSQTDFYWSADSILDGSDILLMSKSEPSLGDTLFSKEMMVYSKPTLTPGKYYILYVTDPANIISEMREFNNAGYFVINQQPFTNLPYANDFESQIDNWSHNSSIGSDDWEWSTPFKPSMTTAFSGAKAWVTKDSSGATAHSKMHLLSPVFDLTQLSDPVIQFNMVNFTLNTSYWTQGATNMSYSTDGGFKWKVLTPSNRSFARWIERTEFDFNGGLDKWTWPYRSSAFDGRDQPMMNDNFTYQTRDADEVTTFSMDMIALAGSKQIQFKLNFANENGGMDGVMMDDFRIYEGAPDLVITNSRHLYCDSSDAFLKINLSIKNAGNKIVNQLNYDVYLSTDSILDGADFLFYSNAISDSIKPSFRREEFIKNQVPPNYSTYEYVIFDLDPTNVISESDETNNRKSWPLDMHQNPPLSYMNNFDSTEIDGWTQYIDSSGYRFDHRFRHIKVAYDPAYGVSSGYWFMDPMPSYSSYLSGVTRYYLESPSFDFSNFSNILTEFDFLSQGSSYTGNTQGGNFQYSEDGGVNWITLTVAQDPYAVNWYNVIVWGLSVGIETLFNQPGWAYSEGLAPFKHAEYDLSFLQGKRNVRFRFQYCANHQTTSPGPQGFRLDNFQINSTAVDLVANEVLVAETADIAQPFFTINYSVSNTGNAPSIPTYTNFYWSENNIFDSTDVQLYSYSESIINALSINTHTKNIYYPTPVDQYVYYLFYKTDYDSVVVETNENNNVGSYVVTFNGLSGIQENQNHDGLMASVNNGILSVTGHLRTDDQEGQAELYAASGKLAVKEKFTVDGKKFGFEIPVNQLASGIYLLNLKFMNNSMQQIKLSITK